MNQKITKPLDLVDKPVFLENQARKIVYSNKKALNLFERVENGWNVFLFQDYFNIYDSQGTVCTYRPTGDLYTFQEEFTSQNDQIYKKITLTPLSEMVTSGMLESYKVMAERLVHQFRSPLASVYGFSEMLAGAEGEPEGGIRKEYLQKIDHGLKDIFGLLDQIEDFAKPVSVDYSVFTLDALLLSLFETFGADCQSRITLKKPAQVFRINCDFYLLRRVLVELLKNALEATEENPDKKVLLTVCDQQGVIEVRNRIPGGITSRDFQNIFVPFYSTKALQIGLGLSRCLLYCHELGINLLMKFDCEQRDVIFQIRGFPFSTN